MSFWSSFKEWFLRLSSLNGQLDTDSASDNIRKNIHFQGPNVWILAFSIVIASVGLNINSTAVIIGAMLISPLMGPILGLGLGLGVNDTILLRDSLKNLLVMVVVSLIAASLYFLLSPLQMANPTELEARTSPSIYDVLIALFGGMAGILEHCRKEKGTVLSGVAIATALMPPLCTAGYGIAHGLWRFFFGAMGLFIINTVFIAFATFIFVKSLHFSEKRYISEERQRRNRGLITMVLVLIMVPSMISAFFMIRENNFAVAAEKFVNENRDFSGGFIYNYRVKDNKVEIYLAGEKLSDEDRAFLYGSAKTFGIKEDQLNIVQHTLRGAEERDELISSMSDRYDRQLSARDKRIESLEAELGKAAKMEIPYERITREVSTQYPEVEEIILSRGASVTTDSLKTRDCILVLVRPALDSLQTARLTQWLRLRLDDDSVTVLSESK